MSSERFTWADGVGASALDAPRRFRVRPTRSVALLIVCIAACQVAPGDEGAAEGGNAADFAGVANAHENAIIDLWDDGIATFGVFVPNERPPTEEQRRSGERPPPVYTREGGRRLARNPLYDFLFLNLEGGYDSEAVGAIAEGLRAPGAAGRKTLLVRIPPIERDGEEVARVRVREILELGADGVVFPHVRTPEEARTVVSFFDDAGADVWSPANPSGEILAMIMV